MHTLTQYIYGFIPVSRQHTIKISHSGGAFGTTKVSIPFNLLDMDRSAVIAPLADMERMRGADGHVTGGGAVSRKAMASVLTASSEPNGLASDWASDWASEPSSEPASDFDPDAIMARYLAQREAEAQTQAAATPQMPPRVAGFGRKRA